MAEILIVSIVLTIFISVFIKANKEYNSSENKEKRKRQFDSNIHKECPECFGTGQDISWGSCLDCEGKGFVEKNRIEIWKDNIR